MNWETCCLPLKPGGLGMRNMVVQNSAYIMKLAYHFVTNTEKLWVRVLCAKYKVMETCPINMD